MLETAGANETRLLTRMLSKSLHNPVIYTLGTYNKGTEDALLSRLSVPGAPDMD